MVRMRDEWVELEREGGVGDKAGRAERGDGVLYRKRAEGPCLKLLS